MDSGPSEEFEALVEALIAANPTPKPAESSLMSGRWKMAWTTEKVMHAHAHVHVNTHTHTHTHTCGKLACLAPLSRLRRRSQEILFCVEKGLFGLPCTDVYQTIDADQGTLGNVIEFTDQGFLKVL